MLDSEGSYLPKYLDQLGGLAKVGMWLLFVPPSKQNFAKISMNEVLLVCNSKRSSKKARNSRNLVLFRCFLAQSKFVLEELAKLQRKGKVKEINRIKQQRHQNLI